MMSLCANNIVQIGIGPDISLALDANGRIYSWGAWDLPWMLGRTCPYSFACNATPAPVTYANGQQGIIIDWHVI